MKKKHIIYLIVIIVFAVFWQDIFSFIAGIYEGLVE